MSRVTDPAARTAVNPMALAAIEQYEPPERRLVHDELATAFLPRALRRLVAFFRWAPLRRGLIALSDRAGPGLWVNVVCRKRYIDEKLKASLQHVDTVVVLGAGMDTRAYRLAHRCSMPVFELDLPVNIERKRAVVRRALGGPPPTVHLVAMDFEADDLWEALIANGFRSEQRAFFIWEGVTQYLTTSAVRAAFEQLRHAARGSRLVFTYIRDDFIRGVELHGADLLYRRFRQRRQVWKFGLSPDAVPAFIARYGWHMVEQAGPDYLEYHYVRPTGRTLRASQIEWSVYAEKR